MTDNQIKPLDNNAVAETSPPPILTAIEQVVMRPDIDVDKIEKMLEMQLRIEDREAEKQFNQSFSKLQNELPEIAESTQGHGYNYAAFEHIQKAVKPILARHGFSMTFDVANSGDSVAVTGYLRHASGHKISSSYSAPLDKTGSKSSNPLQATGSTISYLERYLTVAMLNITTYGVDDDAFSASSAPVHLDDDFWIKNASHAANLNELKDVYTKAQSHGVSEEALNAIKGMKGKYSDNS